MCSECGKRCYRKGNLKTHMAVPTREKNYQFLNVGRHLVERKICRDAWLSTQEPHNSSVVLAKSSSPIEQVSHTIW